VLSTAYALPFAFELPPDNPWDGRRAAELVVHAARPLSAADAERLGTIVQSFWFLAAAGGLAGTAVAPWLSSFPAPRLYVHGHSVRFVFSPSTLDEGATSCLVMLLLSAHEEIPLQGARLSVPGSPIGAIGFQSSMEDPYPELWRPLPFPVKVDENSESETRELRVQFEAPLSDEQVMGAQDMLWSWGKASEWGAFALPPLPPRSSSCLASDPVEHYEGELTWPVTKCRFHRSALDSLVSVCAAIHHRVARIREVTIE
jgi:hypothetical protein